MDKNRCETFAKIFSLSVVALNQYHFRLIILYNLSDPVEKVTLSSSNLQRTITYWKDVLSLKVYQQDDSKVLLGFGDNQAKLEFEDIGEGNYSSMASHL